MKVLILAPFADEPLVELQNEMAVVVESWTSRQGGLLDPQELGRRLNDEQFEAVVVEADFLFSETFEAAPKLKFAGICRSATNQVDIEAATERGVVVVNTPGRNAPAVAELTLGLMLAASRRIVEGDRYMRSGRWTSPTGAYIEMRGSELSGRTLGIVGLGAIGRRVAELGNAFGMHVLAYDPFVRPADAEKAGATWCDLDLLLESVDYLTLHAPAPLDGEPLLDSDRLSRLKNGAILVNTAAAELVDQAAMIEALGNGRLAAAGLDIFSSHPIEPGSALLRMDNVALTPHIGGATDGAVSRHSAMMASDLIRFDNGERPVNLVNPEAWDRRRGA
jgi:D-3-phosphoglycerate dehydrogenase